MNILVSQTTHHQHIQDKLKEKKEMKIKQLIEAKRVIMPLVQEKLSPRLSYKLMKFIKEIEVEEDFYNKKLNELVDKYGERDENDKLVYTDDGVKIREDKMSDCNAELQEIGDVDVDAPSITFTLDELDSVKLSVSDMFFLQDFIVE